MSKPPDLGHNGGPPLDDDLLAQMATPLPVSDKIEIEGISLPDALRHPVLGAILVDFHDRLHWSKDRPERDGAEGIEKFVLRLRLAQAGFPLRSMPPPRQAAEIIRDHAMRLLEPLYRDAALKASWDSGELIERPSRRSCWRIPSTATRHYWRTPAPSAGQW